uniref:C2CD3 N-terminal C2 domain-containing protein n=1 Tax=Glossina brevipalpis TaxID=37001 RepID=A0A1A9WH51_9MUSC
MNGCVNCLPPSAQVYASDRSVLQGYLEIEVSYLRFIINRPVRKKSCELSRTEIDIRNKRKIVCCVNEKLNCNLSETRSRKVEELAQQQRKQKQIVQVKFIWWGERNEDAAKLYISCESLIQSQEQLQQHTKYQFNRQQQYVEQHHLATNKLRYRICTSGALFLTYLRSCQPIEIIVTNIGTAEPLGQANLRLPIVLLRKYAASHTQANSFEHKTKIYALYCKTNVTTTNKNTTRSVKSGEIQLHFRMLFAPTAALAAKHSLQQDQLTSQLQHRHHHHSAHMHGKALVQDASQGDKPVRLTSQSKSEEIVEAMKKLDAKLVAYLAGQNDITTKINSSSVDDDKETAKLQLIRQPTNEPIKCILLEDECHEKKLEIFKSITGVKLEMEALTLQPEGTKRMELLQTEIRPIFTVECQLSNELIHNVPRYEMFHIMQFESEKFQNLTQCTRFGQEAQRNVRLQFNDNLNANLNNNGDDDNDDDNANDGHDSQLNFGSIHFTVWWREPGTCLNEMLGMGILKLVDLYNASLLEQCKRINIQRRGIHLASLYFKIILQRDLNAQHKFQIIERGIALHKQKIVDSDESPSAGDKTMPSSKQETVSSGNQMISINADKATYSASAQNNNIEIESSNFDDETSKIRLLKGFIYANEMRRLVSKMKMGKFLVCRRFWLDEPATVLADDTNHFNYQEQFSVVNDEKFLERMDKQYLHLELWQRLPDNDSNDSNGNESGSLQPVGIVRMPLHQFFIAYRDDAITNHLCKGKLPVISMDTWAPVVNCQTGVKVGELKCLLAVGSEEQIKYLKELRGFTQPSAAQMGQLFHNKIIEDLPILQLASTSNSPDSSLTLSTTQIKQTADLLDMLQKALSTPPSSAATTPTPFKAANATPNLKPLQQSNAKLFKFALEIQRAIDLPLNPPAGKSKKSSKRNGSKRFPPNEPPSCYVTFQADEGQYPTYKSHEGMVYATNIVEKSTQPRWQQRFRLATSTDYLNNLQKRFILKVWKKSALDIAQARLQPTPMEDAIVGFAALDFTVFVRGLQIGGYFNIVDFNGRINGQLEIRCHPLEDLTPAFISHIPHSLPNVIDSSSVDFVIDQFEQTLDLAHLNLGQAIKRKFTELESISYRLRARLGDVAGSTLPQDFDFSTLDKWQSLQLEEVNDNDLEEFEHDLNNTPIDIEEEESEQKKAGKTHNEEIKRSE